MASASTASASYGASFGRGAGAQLSASLKSSWKPWPSAAPPTLAGSNQAAGWWLHGAMTNHEGLLLDFGGVVTTDFFASLGAHCERLGLPHDSFRNLVTADPEGR